MTYTLSTVAAAIATISDDLMDQAGVDTLDADGMAKAMAEAETMVANQLARAGMALKEARDLASEAAMKTGRESPESRALSDEAFRNRFARTPEDTTAAPTAPDEVEAHPETIEETAPDATPTVTAAAEATARVRGPATAPAPVHQAVAHVVRQEPAIGYEMTTKKPHEVFVGMDAADADFDFDLPFINWERRHPGVPDLDPGFVFDPAALHTVLYAIADRSSAILVGPHGCGKTQIVLQVAARLNFPVTVLPMDGQLSRRELIGHEKLRATANGTESYFLPGLLPLALMEPGFILFDEVDRGVSDLQYACHSVYLQDGLKLLEDGGRFIRFHEHNRVFATANTKGRGSLDGMYQPPEEMSEATRDRWSLWVDMDYPDVETDTTVLTRKIRSLDASHAEIIAKVAAQIRASYKEGRLSQTCSMRNMLDVARKSVFVNRSERDDVRRLKGLRLAFERVVLGRASPEDKGAIEVQMTTVMPEAYQGDPIF